MADAAKDFNRVAVVTGAGRGIGQQIAVDFASRGVNLVLNSLGEERLDATAHEATELGARVVIVPGDVTSTEVVKRIISTAHDEFGRVDILVNNAGANDIASLVMASEERWQELFEVNIFAAFRLTKVAIRSMIRNRWGRIVNIASVAGEIGAAYNGAYSSSKAALIGFTKSIAREVAATGITANAVNPWHVNTELVRSAMSGRGKLFGKPSEEYLKSVCLASPRKSMITVEEVSSLVTYLASEEASGINGQSISVCGGANTA
ncbi:MAG: SDR family NAD(P)-dependent oxidoreductase [Planctomycetota bacterium]